FINGSLNVADGTFDADGYELLVGNNVEVAGTLDLSSGTDGNVAMRVGGSWDAAGGVFTSTDSTVMFTGTAAALAITSNTNAFYNVTINDGLIGYWKFDETAANMCAGGVNDACDSSGYQRDGTWVGSVASSTTPAKVRFADPRSIDFPGGADAVDVPIPALTSYTYSAWIYTRGFSNGAAGDGAGTYFVDRGVSGQPLASLKAVGGNFAHQRRADNGAGIGAVSGAAISLNTWQHVVWGREYGSEFFIFVDGVKSSVADALGALTPDNPRLGNHFGLSGGHDGLIDDFRIYNRALTTAEVQTMAAGYQPGTAVGTYTLQDNLDVNGTLTLNAGELDTGADRDITVAVSWMNHGGVFTANNSDVFFDGTPANGLILSGSQTFYNVDLTTSGTWALQDDIPVSNGLDISAGALTYSTDTNIDPINVDGDTALTGGSFAGNAVRFRHDGDLSISSGTYTAPADVLEIDGTFTHSGGTFTNTGSTVMFTGTGMHGIDVTGGAVFADVIVNDGLVGYWKFDEAATNSCIGGINDACDSSGYGNDGIHTNGPTITAATAPVRFNNRRSLSFDNTDDIVEILPNAAINIGDKEALTVTAWINANSDGEFGSGGFGRITNKLNGYDFMTQNLSGSNVELQAGVIFDTTSAQAITNAIVPINTWVHVAFTFNEDGNKRIKIYVDGVLAALTTDNAGAGSYVDDSNASLLIGNDSNAERTFDGEIDELRIYNRALSVTQVLALATGGTPATSLGRYTLQTNLDVDGTLTINAGELDAGTNRSINVGGGWLNHGGVFDEQSGQVTLDAQSGTVGIQELQTFYDLIIDDTPGAAATFEQYSALDVNNDLTIAGGELDASTDNYGINLAGNWTNNDLYTAQSGTFTLDGVNQSLVGATAFHNLAKTETSNDTLDSIITWEAGTTFVVGNELTIDGLDNNDRVNLVSSVPGTRWNLDVTAGDQRINYVDVTDGEALSNDIIAANSIDNNNNDSGEATPHFVFSFGNIYEWTGASDQATWEDQLNWDFGDGSAGDDGYPDDAGDKAYFMSTSHTIDTPAGTLTIGDIETQSGFAGTIILTGTLVVDDSTGLMGDVLFVTGTFAHLDNNTAETYKFVVQADGDFTLGSVAQINLTGLGYDANQGPGQPVSTRDGGAYGGSGGDYQIDGTANTNVYGSITAPVNIGSGGDTTGAGSSGGGALIMTIAGTSTIDGTIVADGADGGDGSGSGGSIFITTGTLTGTGTL
ncbi:MAG: LamG domain-containing protein, partial [Candidatus Omnitrophica bacterium]|nr:LamG domain-containing protein [Candidatus Omnitrophota bacterium]